MAPCASRAWRHGFAVRLNIIIPNSFAFFSAWNADKRLVEGPATRYGGMPPPKPHPSACGVNTVPWPMLLGPNFQTTPTEQSSYQIEIPARNARNAKCARSHASLYGIVFEDCREPGGVQYVQYASGVQLLQRSAGHRPPCRKAKVLNGFRKTEPLRVG